MTSNFEWDLSNLFFDDQTFNLEMDSIRDMIYDLEQYKNQEMNSKLLYKLLNKKWQIKERANKILVYGSLRYYKNIHDDISTSLKQVAESFNSEVEEYLLFIDHAILALEKSKIESFFYEEPNLEIYRQYLDNLFRMQEHVPNDENNKKIQENNTNIRKEIENYTLLLRDITFDNIEVEGETIELTSSNFVKYLSSKNREIREKAYLKVNESYRNEQEKFANILNNLYALRIENANLEKYNSVLEKILFEENIDSKIISSLIEAVNDNLELIQNYLKIKANCLGIGDPHLYDFGVPLNNDLNIKYSLEEAVDIIKQALKPLGDKYLQVVDILLEGHVDALPDEKKHQYITFSWNTYSFLNFRGSYVDLKNLIHELGHIVNYYLSHEKQPFLYEDSTVFVGETASLINEILLNKFLYETAKTDEEKIFYFSKNIENFFTPVFKQTMYTELENEFYSIKLTTDLSSEILSQSYEKIIKKYYGKNICYDSVSDVEWARLGHLYRWSYYPYKYATGLLIASTVVHSLLNEHTISQEQYLEFLSSGSSLYSLDLLKLLSIDLTDSNIIENGFKIMEEDIKELESVLMLRK